jgi:Spy/CpxP family protein refolding chaperone
MIEETLDRRPAAVSHRTQARRSVLRRSPLRWLPAASLALGLFLATSLASAECREGGSSCRHHRPGHAHLAKLLEHHAERLGLDEALTTEIRALAEASREKSAALRTQRHELKQQLRTMLYAEAPDEAAVMAQAEKLGELELASHQERLKTKLRILALLSPEQRSELNAIRSELEPGDKGEHGKCRGHSKHHGDGHECSDSQACGHAGCPHHAGGDHSACPHQPGGGSGHE